MGITSVSAAPVHKRNQQFAPLLAFILGIVVTDAMRNDQKVKRKHYKRYNTICVEKTWVPKKRMWVQRHWENGFLIDGHYKTRNGYYEKRRYQC